ncbi:MAG: GGDEF domain-containing phosphodiesterase [Alkalimonas sp.]|nr:GGDEF domain-containing phosphodiesterase [Alkalimonas sp.]
MRYVIVAIMALAAHPVVADSVIVSESWWQWWPLSLVVLILLLLWRIRSLQQRLNQVVATPVEQQWLHDESTGYPNKQLLRMQLQPLLQNAEGRHYALLLFKVTQFERINEALGYHHSNILLAQLAHRINQRLQDNSALLCLEQREDKPVRLCHLGGVDFVAWADITEHPYLAEQLSKEIEQNVVQPLVLHSCAMNYQLASGIAYYPEHGSQLNELLDRAYQALQHHRLQSTDNAVFDPALLHYTDEKLRLMAELRQAIEQDELVLYVQPQIDLKQRHLVAAEVLIRWKHPRLGMLAPDDFLALAEQLGVIYSLTEWVLERAIAMLAELHTDFPNMKIAVNISSKDLLQDELLDTIQRLLKDYDVKPDRLILELTERALTDDPVSAITMLQRLKNLGVELALDDFGTGFSSLFHLRQLPISHVKIDCSFINQLHKSDTHMAITGAIIDIARNLELGVVAEGIEESLVEQKLIRMGCTLGQGFFYSRPFELKGLQPWLSQWRHQHENPPPPPSLA